MTQKRGKWVKPKGAQGLPPVEYPALYGLTIKNFRSVEDLSLEINQSAQLLPNQAPALLILGENSTGKSSILEGMALALAQEGGRRALEINTDTLILDTSLLGVAQKKRALTTTVTLRFQGGENRVLGIKKGGLDVSGPFSTPPVFAYGAFRQYLDTNALDAAPPGSIVNLFHPNRFLLNPETWLMSLEKRAFDEVVRVLRIIFSVDSNFAFMLRDKKHMRCLLVTNAKDEKPAGKTPLQLASSGYRSLLAMVCDILRGLMDPDISPYFQSFPTAQAVVLIDEVEAHLHPRWKIRVMSALREALPGVTIIATSHDPLCLRGMHHGEVVVMRRRIDVDADVSVRVECLSHLPDVGKLTIEQLLTSDFFNLMTTDQPEVAFQLAHIADLLAKKSAGEALSTDEGAAVKAFEGELRSVLPIGGSEAQRLVQEAVAEFLKARASEPSSQMANLRKQYRDEIINILEQF
ncbi:AAA family ATPase [Pseudomonas sp. VS59]|nr:AAA family ATPase [Pseudomonas sp. VS59]